jgi:hypothetical protein
MRAPDYIEPVVGWRMWCTTTDDEGVALRSVHRRTVWPRGAPLVADCMCGRFQSWLLRRERHGSPSLECRCGIYASGVPLLGAYLAEWLMWGGTLTVVGRVSLWGRVFEHEHGWRAEMAYPLELFVPVGDFGERRAQEAVEALAAYQVPVSTVDGTSVDRVLRGVAAIA